MKCPKNVANAQQSGPRDTTVMNFVHIILTLPGHSLTVGLVESFLRDILSLFCLSLICLTNKWDCKDSCIAWQIRDALI